jgi:hypothetical protein
VLTDETLAARHHVSAGEIYRMRRLRDVPVGPSRRNLRAEVEAHPCLGRVSDLDLAAELRCDPRLVWSVRRDLGIPATAAGVGPNGYRVRRARERREALRAWLAERPRSSDEAREWLTARGLRASTARALDLRTVGATYHRASDVWRLPRESR